MAGKPEPTTGRLARAGYLALGLIMLALGIVGAFLPLMPTTIFLILAAWCFGRSSPRLERWLLEHPRFGPVLRAWRQHGAIPRRAKWLAATGMAAGYAIFLLTVEPPVWLAALVAAALIGCTAWIATRPEGPTVPGD